MSSAAKKRAVMTATTKGPTGGPPCSGRSARKKTSSAPVSPVANRSVKVAKVTAQTLRSMGAEGYPLRKAISCLSWKARGAPQEVVDLAAARARARDRPRLAGRRRAEGPHRGGRLAGRRRAAWTSPCGRLVRRTSRTPAAPATGRRTPCPRWRQRAGDARQPPWWSSSRRRAARLRRPCSAVREHSPDGCRLWWWPLARSTRPS